MRHPNIRSVFFLDRKCINGKNQTKTGGPVTATDGRTEHGEYMNANRPTARSGQDKIPDMVRSYGHYLSSGLYDRRYPYPNRRTLGQLLRRLPSDGRFLDFGAGTGRYTLPLLQLTNASGVAHDICPGACRIMMERMDSFIGNGRLAIRDDSPNGLADAFPAAFDLVFLAFGVLGHVNGRANRRNVLSMLRRTLKPGGVLIASLPNRARRFRAEQRAALPRVRAGELEEGDVLYARGNDTGSIPMFYHLFTPSEVRREFGEAGFLIESLEPESLLPEKRVVSTPFVGWLDNLASDLLPTGFGFGLLAVARPLTDGGP